LLRTYKAAGDDQDRATTRIPQIIRQRTDCTRLDGARDAISANAQIRTQLKLPAVGLLNGGGMAPVKARTTSGQALHWERGRPARTR